MMRSVSELSGSSKTSAREPVEVGPRVTGLSAGRVPEGVSSPAPKRGPPEGPASAILCRADHRDDPEDDYGVIPELKLHAEDLAGKVETFDRMIFKGHLSSFFPSGAFSRFLHVQGVLLKEFRNFAQKVTARIKQHGRGLAERAGRTVDYLASAHTVRSQSKEDLARQIAARDSIREGLIAVFSTVEPCCSFDVRGNCSTHKLEVVRPGASAFISTST